MNAEIRKTKLRKSENNAVEDESEISFLNDTNE